MKKNYAWFQNLKWDESCLACQAKHGGVCHSKSCAEDNYDEWGDPIPLYVYHADGNTLQKYLEKKRKRMEEQEKCATQE